MGLYVDTVSGNVALPELGITLIHPATNYAISEQFTPDDIRDATSLTSAIIGGQLNWKKTSGGTIETNTEYDPDFVDVDLENTGTGLVKDDRAVTFKDLTGANITGVSPGFNFGRGGASPPGTWLNRVGNVPSNIVGLPIFLDNGFIYRVAIANATTTSYKIEIYEHDQTTYTLLTSVICTTTKELIAEGLSVAVTKGKQLAAKVADDSAGTPQNVGVTVSMKGDVS